MVNKSIKKLFVGFAFLSATNLVVASQALTTSQNFLQPRAFSTNIAREMLMEGAKHRDSDGWYGLFSMTAAYQRSWTQGVESTSGNDLGSSVNPLGVLPFWSGTNVMTIGTNLSNGTDFDAYQFGMGPVTLAADSTITLDPIVYQAGADFMFIVGSSANEPGFFAKIKAPVGVYNMNPQLTETSTTTSVPYVSGSLSTAASADTVADPATTMTQAFAGNTSGGQTAQGDFTAMQYGLINSDQSTGAKFGDIEMTAGYAFVSNHDNSFNIAVRASAPTGNKATGEYILEPIFGRGGNWGLGGYAAGHVNIWEGNNDNRFQLKFMSEAMHLFTTDTVRSYDLTANGVGSKYLLVANYASDSYQSGTGAIQNLINFTTLASESSFGVEGDVAVSFAYIARGWSVDLGYEFFGRSAETLVVTGTLANNYAILGRQGVAVSGGAGTQMNACQPFATISSSLANSDAVQAGTTVVTTNIVAVATASGNRITGVDALNVTDEQQAAYLTSKVFSKVAYEWVDSDYRPHLGVMGEFEISNANNNALPQWSVLIVGGVSF